MVLCLAIFVPYFNGFNGYGSTEHEIYTSTGAGGSSSITVEGTLNTEDQGSISSYVTSLFDIYRGVY